MHARGLDQRRHRRGLHQRGGPTTKKDGFQPSSGQQTGLMSEVGEQRLAPSVLVDAVADMAVEVAIGAFADAKRPVDVERQGLAAHSSSAATNLRKASARWLMSCLNSGSSSPNVWSYPTGTNIGS